MNKEKSKTSEPYKFVLNMSHKDFKSSNKRVALQGSSIYYM